MTKLLEEKEGQLYYAGYNLYNLAKKYGTPLKITFLDVIKMRIRNLKESFDQAGKEIDYKGKFLYLNANKANYGLEEIYSAYQQGDGLETSSYYDLLLTGKIFRNEQDKKRLIVCNGYKSIDYLKAIISLYKDGYKIIDVIDSYDEYLFLKEQNIDLEVGLRIHLSALYAEEGEAKDDRFGLTKEEFLKIVDDISNTRLVLSTIHFHQRGFDYEEEKFEENFLKVFEEYYVYAKKKIKTIHNYDIGGGTPLPLSDDFDYYKWAKYVLGLLKKEANKYGIEEPDLLSENGKYSQKDSTVNIYKVLTRKNIGEYPWHIIDGSLLIALPEHYALGEPIEVLPINDLDKTKIKGLLGGVTCDCDDVYFLKDRGYIELPDSKDLYIGLLGTGSYQNSMNGKGGVHHCLLPEEKDVIIYRDDKNQNIEKIRKEIQTIDDIFALIRFA